jgi:hypothetical protein
MPLMKPSGEARGLSYRGGINVRSTGGGEGATLIAADHSYGFARGAGYIYSNVFSSRDSRSFWRIKQLSNSARLPGCNMYVVKYLEYDMHIHLLRLLS